MRGRDGLSGCVTPVTRAVIGRRYHTVEVPLTLYALSGVLGQPLLTALPGAFIAVHLRQLLTVAQARGSEFSWTRREPL